MANIGTNQKKTKATLPFADYIRKVKQADAMEYNALIAEIKSATCIRWDYTISRYERGVIRPAELHRRIIAEVIAKHSDCATITGDMLFPAEYYTTR